MWSLLHAGYLLKYNYIASLVESSVLILFPFFFVSELRFFYLENFPLWQLNQNEGIISAHQSEISKHKIDLKNPDYKDIDKRYFDQLIQLKVWHLHESRNVSPDYSYISIVSLIVL